MNIKHLTLAIMASLSPFAAHAQVSIEPLANNKCIIRVAPETKEKYLLLPIEEQAAESHFRVIVNNTQQRTLNVRLAQKKVDYYVPMELDEFRGKNLVLFTHVNGEKPDNSIILKEVKLSDTFDTTNRETYRPDYHFTPSYGWMNDPNGMFYLNGKWHLFYQYGPYGSMWNNMTWGHAVTEDLIHWTHLKPAILPDAHGQIFSGSCIVDKDNTAGFGKGAVIAMYTSAGEVQSQSIAYSTDGGMTFKVYEGNPVLTADIADFRDPNMFWYEPTQKWVLVMSAGQEDRIYSSPDMKHWTEESRFGTGLGSHGGVWECPDLMQLPIVNRKSSNRKSSNGKSSNCKSSNCQMKWVMYCNINPGGPAGGSATQYFIGDFDGHKFTVDDEARYADGRALWQDYGKDHYATVSFSNAPGGRHTMIAWMSNWQYANNVPTMQYRSANSICREPYLYYGADKKLYLGSKPSPEYDGKGLDKTVKISGSCTVTLSNKEGEEFRIIYDQKKMTLTCDRSKSGKTDFSQDFAVNSVAPVHNKLKSLRIFIDNSSVEVFGNNGEVVMTNIVFPQSKYDKVTK